MGQPSFRFTKLNAAGNDFVCLDSTNGEYAALLQSGDLGGFVRRICWNAHTTAKGVVRSSANSPPLCRRNAGSYRTAAANWRKTPKPAPQAAPLWGRVKEIDGQLLHGLLGRLVQARHVCGLRYWQSRGGILPWSIALGGEAFFQAVIARSECVVEPPPEVRQGEGTTT